MTANNIAHPAAELLRDYSLGKLDDSTGDEILSHLDQCLPCCDAVVACANDSFIDRLRSVPDSDGERTPYSPPIETQNSKEADVPVPTISPYPGDRPALPVEGLECLLAPAQMPGEMGRLGRFRILKEIGRGGMGIVLHADDPQLQRQVAIKVMLPKIASNNEAKDRFLREARNMAAVVHDHIVLVHDVVDNGQAPYIVMPLLIGQSLDARLKLGPPLTVAETLTIGLGVARGLAAAHQSGLIHRDIKPANIWLEGDPCASATEARVKILDFGLARREKIATEGGDSLTREGMVLGSPPYMSPEQARSQPVDPRSDLYNVGVMLYQMSGGQLPFTATTATDYALAHITKMPSDVRKLNRSIPPLLAKTIMQLLAKEPSDRPASAQDLANTLHGLIIASPSPDAEARPSTRSCFRWPSIVGGIVAIMLLASVAYWMYDHRQPVADKNDPVPPVPQGPQAKDGKDTPTKPPLRVKALRVKHKIKTSDSKGIDKGFLGDKSSETWFGDHVYITAELTRPAYCYLLGFNCDGKEQLLWPVNENLKSDERTIPPQTEQIVYPVKEKRWFSLNDKKAGGLQAFAVLASLEPLPAYAEWKAKRGPAAWGELPAGQGVWSSDGKHVFPMVAGNQVRGQEEKELDGSPPLSELGQSLLRGTRFEAIELLAFPVRTKEEK